MISLLVHINRESRIMKIRQRWYRRQQLLNQSIIQPLLSRLFDTSLFTSRLVALCVDGSSVPVLSQDWQKPEPATVFTLENIHSALAEQVLLCYEGGSINGGFA